MEEEEEADEDAVVAAHDGDDEKVLRDEVLEWGGSEKKGNYASDIDEMMARALPFPFFKEGQTNTYLS